MFRTLRFQSKALAFCAAERFTVCAQSQRGKLGILGAMRHRHAAVSSMTALCVNIVRLPQCGHNSVYNHWSEKRSFSSTIDDNSTVEEQYSRKSPREHVLLRPGMYVGPNTIMPASDPCWVLDNLPPFPPEHLRYESLKDCVASEEGDKRWIGRMVKREFEVAPALVKIFDEILVNASDNRLRHPKTCNQIDVVIDPGSSDREPLIRVFNNGKGIPVKIHKGENMYVPEMLFGHLLTGSNFDDTTKRVTGGRHGYGAKLTNIFSKVFTVEVADSSSKKLYKQTWTNNMSNIDSPDIAPYEGKEDYTCISFIPDLERLTSVQGSSSIGEDEYALMCRRVLDVAGCSDGKLRVSLNGVNVSVDSFNDYMALYPSTEKMIFRSINARWRIGVGLSENGFQMVSFVNGMATDRGGTHVDVITKQILKAIQERIEKIDKELHNFVTREMILRSLFVSVDSLIENPSFDSQMKENLTTNPTEFGSSYTLPPAFLKEILQTETDGGPGIIEEITRLAKQKMNDSLSKTITKKKSKKQLLAIEKLDDAHQAGGPEGHNCTLILTEGDSAKALAVAGLEVVGRDKFGVFPLRGKFLNVRHASSDQMKKNEEVKALGSILGLSFQKSYETAKERSSLRYGRVMVMCDQDTDGSHIKGLVINYFKHFWPNLLRPPRDKKDAHPFLSTFVTPLLKARKGKKDILSFYSEADFNEWKEKIGGDISKWQIKYYKGLGTSSSAEAKEYFSAFNQHVRTFRWKSDVDDDLLDMAFDKERADDRRNWINETYDKRASIYAIAKNTEASDISYQDFINKELIHFSHGDNIRSIPSLIDGLKPSQRKVLFACFKRKLKSEVKVAQLSGYCAEHSSYHHGEASLQATIVKLAQDFVGSNNVNLLVPSGQFGTRLKNGEDAASPRYIFTHLSPVARALFPEVDDPLLTYREDDGQKIEPEFYCPIIPLVLVNGSKGIGTGWSTDIPSYNPRDIVEYIRAKLDNKTQKPTIHPYTRGFSGRIETVPTGFVSFGRVTEISPTELLIDELPIHCSTTKYKEQLLKMQESKSITGFTEDHTTTKVSFTISLSRASLKKMKQEGLEKQLKLSSNLSTKNMHAFDAQGTITKLSCPEDAVELFYPVRLALYEDRISVLQSEAEYNAQLLRNKARFIRMVVADDINLRTSKAEMLERVEELGFDTSMSLTDMRRNNVIWKRQQEGTKEYEDNEDTRYDYLLNMPLSSLTSERISELEEEAQKKDRQMEEIRGTTAEELWHQDLDNLEPLLPS